ncbi:hypothetical protein GOP47_0017322 [Adiantum capillus-veneris]|uniref:Uncharacterized protein n=1 Tax=Adiantum capillus-veneris TaxID=13818 RepID=A0A9D4UG74_ADICA|nr:hypothetical protein GOP47_0017322 [Adiantum capillus-veneris]
MVDLSPIRQHRLQSDMLNNFMAHPPGKALNGVGLNVVGQRPLQVSPKPSPHNGLLIVVSNVWNMEQPSVEEAYG